MAKIRKNYRFKDETVQALKKSLEFKNQELKKNNYPEWTETDMLEWFVAEHYMYLTKSGRIKEQ